MIRFPDAPDPIPFPQCQLYFFADPRTTQVALFKGMRTELLRLRFGTRTAQRKRQLVPTSIRQHGMVKPMGGCFHVTRDEPINVTDIQQKSPLGRCCVVANDRITPEIRIRIVDVDVAGGVQRHEIQIIQAIHIPRHHTWPQLGTSRSSAIKCFSDIQGLHQIVIVTPQRQRGIRLFLPAPLAFPHHHHTIILPSQLFFLDKGDPMQFFHGTIQPRVSIRVSIARLAAVPIAAFEFETRARGGGVPIHRTHPRITRHVFASIPHVLNLMVPFRLLVEPQQPFQCHVGLVVLRSISVDRHVGDGVDRHVLSTVNLVANGGQRDGLSKRVHVTEALKFAAKRQDALA